MWLACNTQEEIGKRLDVTQKTISNWIDDVSNIGNLAKSSKSLAEHATDFDIPLYNIWNAYSALGTWTRWSLCEISQLLLDSTLLVFAIHPWTVILGAPSITAISCCV